MFRGKYGMLHTKEFHEHEEAIMSKKVTSYFLFIFLSLYFLYIVNLHSYLFINFFLNLDYAMLCDEWSVWMCLCDAASSHRE